MIELSLLQLAQLFPAYVLVDQNARIVKVGPSVDRLIPGLVAGTCLFDHLKPEPDGGLCELERFADRHDVIHLRSMDGRFALAGQVLRFKAGYMIALSHAPFAASLAELPLSIEDFSCSDPAVPTYLQIGILQSLLEESRETAIDLARERERSVELVDRIKLSAGFLAHDLNNLHSIIELNCINALKAGLLPSDQEHRIKVILESVNRSIEATKALTIVAKQKNDSGLPEDIDELIRESWPYFRMIVGARVTLMNDLKIGPVKIELSRNGLINSLTSLLMNSREALAAAGTAKIATWIDHETGCVQIEVSDTGAGMDPAVLETAFEPFFSTKGTGTGLGLVSVIEFAREAGGDAQIHSAPGRGTTVVITLPLVQSARTASPLPASQAEAPDVADWRPSSAVRVLVVEDEPYALEALTELLEDEGYDVTPAISAAEALAELDKARFNVLLTDVLMPECDGMQLATRAGQLDARMNIILMSGYMPEFLNMQPEWLFIRKPLDVDVLRSLIAMRVPKTKAANSDTAVKGYQ
jgi:signal transduction histidine kinase/CheY-like chemotaxis protein